MRRREEKEKAHSEHPTSALARLKGIVKPKWTFLASLILKLMSLSFYLQWNTKRNVLKNVPAAVLHIIKVNGY